MRPAMRGRLRQLAWRIGDEPILAALLVSQHSSFHFEDISHWFCWNLVLSACFILLCETIFTQFSCRKPQKHMKTSDQTPVRQRESFPRYRVLKTRHVSRNRERHAHTSRGFNNPARTRPRPWRRRPKDWMPLTKQM